MAGTPAHSEFSELQAVKAAGDFAGFVREVYAESKRLIQLEVAICGMPEDTDELRQMIGEITLDIVYERIADDLDRLLMERLAEIALLPLTDAELYPENKRAQQETAALPMRVTEAVLRVILKRDNQPAGSSN